MNKALLLSIKPEHAINILNGNKTLELRKSVPKGYKGWVYVYVTKGERLSVVHDDENGETYYYLNSHWGRSLNQDVPFRFWFDEYIAYEFDEHNYFPKRAEDFRCNAEEVLKRLCLTREQVKDYGKGKDIYAWHIKNIHIFDKPMQLGEFTTTIIPNNAIIEKNGEGMPYFYKKERPSWHMNFSYLTKAPQSYMYVYVKEAQDD